MFFCTTHFYRLVELPTLDKYTLRFVGYLFEANLIILSNWCAFTASICLQCSSLFCSKQNHYRLFTINDNDPAVNKSGFSYYLSPGTSIRTTPVEIIVQLHFFLQPRNEQLKSLSRRQEIKIQLHWNTSYHADKHRQLSVLTNLNEQFYLF